MALLTRQQIVDICNRDRTNSLQALDIVNVLLSYCEDKCPETKHDWDSIKTAIDLSITLLIQRGMWLSYFKTAIAYFKVKFLIYEMYSKEEETMTPLGVQKTRKLLLVY